eukprot:254756-Pleurochrysis_carterae.AAC.5
MATTCSAAGVAAMWSGFDSPRVRLVSFYAVVLASHHCAYESLVSSQQQKLGHSGRPTVYSEQEGQGRLRPKRPASTRHNDGKLDVGQTAATPSAEPFPPHYAMHEQYEQLEPSSFSRLILSFALSHPVRHWVARLHHCALPGILRIAAARDASAKRSSASSAASHFEIRFG